MWRLRKALKRSLRNANKLKAIYEPNINTGIIRPETLISLATRESFRAVQRKKGKWRWTSPRPDKSKIRSRIRQKTGSGMTTDKGFSRGVETSSHGANGLHGTTLNTSRTGSASNKEGVTTAASTSAPRTPANQSAPGTYQPAAKRTNKPIG